MSEPRSVGRAPTPPRRGPGRYLYDPETAASQFSGGRRLDHRVSHMLEQAAEYERAHGPSMVAAPHASEPAVGYRAVTTEVDGVVVLDRLSLLVRANSRTAVIGLTGPGKGAFVDQIFGRTLPSEGDVITLGENTRQLGTEDERAAHARRMGVVLRDGGLFSSWSMYDNVAVLLRNEYSVEEARIAALVGEVLEEVGLADKAALLPESLAPGHCKRGGIARALVAEPELVVIDELEAGLDRERAALMAELIVHLHERRGGTFLMLTQDLEAAVLTADELILMHRGRLVAAGTPAALQNSSNPHIRELLSL